MSDNAPTCQFNQTKTPLSGFDGVINTWPIQHVVIFPIEKVQIIDSYQFAILQQLAYNDDVCSYELTYT